MTPHRTSRYSVLQLTLMSFDQFWIAAGCTARDLYLLIVVFLAYHSAMGDDFRGLTFSQNDMRQHLVECFERKQLSAFPQTSGTVTKNARKHLFVHIHCECQLPDSYDSKMIECERCNHWFHFKCVKLCKQVPETWYCKHCK